LWHCNSTRDRSGGMLVGVNLLSFNIGEIEERNYFVKFKIKNKTIGF
jgi:hypothetical protein